jgi:quercetin dioxygenase-like cupin family protein
MFVIKDSVQVPLEPVQEGIGIRWVIGPKDDAPNFALRIIEIQPGITFTPHHHPYEHEIYVLEGRGVLLDKEGDEAAAMKPGVALLVPPNELHGYRNDGQAILKFICVIPLQS